MRRLWSSGLHSAGVARRLFGHFSKESPRLLLLSTTTAVVQSALLIPIALLVRHMFDTEIPRRSVGSIIASGSTILALYAVSALLGYLSRVAALRITATITTRLRLDLLAKLYTLPQSWHDRRRAAPIHSVAVQDSERVEAMLAAVAGQLLPAALVGFALVIVALIVNPTLFVTLLVVVPPLMIGGIVLGRRLRTRAERWSESSRRFSAYAQLLLRAMVSTKVVGGEEWQLHRGDAHASELADRYRALGAAGAAFAAVQSAVAAAAGTAVLVVGGIAVAHHTMSLGNLLAFYAVLALLLRQLHTVGFQSSIVLIGLQSLGDIEALLGIAADEPYQRGKRALEFRGGVALAGVSFAYEDVDVLREVTLSIEPSEHVAVIGPNGAGKSTLVSLLLGLYEPHRGQLRADGVSYEELQITGLRRQIGVVLQDPVLVPGTIRENIAYARPETGDAAVRAAAEAATAADFIEALPDGYSTLIGDEGTGLSGGQRQRIAVARALLGTPALLVLDEPTTYLDEVAVRALMAKLVALAQAPTVLLVTHDPQVASHVERVIELRDGRVVGDVRVGPRVAAAAR